MALSSSSPPLEDLPYLTAPSLYASPHQAHMDTSIPEVHLPAYHYPNLPGPADYQCLFDNNVGKNKGYLIVPAHVLYNLRLSGQDCRKLAPYCYRAHVIPSGWLHSQLVPTMLPNSVFRDSPHPGATRRCGAASLHRLPAAKCAHVTG